MVKTKEEKVFTLRIDAELLKQISEIAEENMRSTAKEIEFILREEIKRRTNQKEKVKKYLDMVERGNLTPEERQEIKEFTKTLI